MGLTNFQVFVGEYLIYAMDNKLVYEDVIVSQNPSNLSTIIPAILVPLLVAIIALAALIVGVFYFNVIRGKRTVNLVNEMIGEEGERYYIVQVTCTLTLIMLLNIIFIAKPIVLQCLHFYNPQTCKSCVSINTVYGHGHNNKHFKSQLNYDR